MVTMSVSKREVGTAPQGISELGLGPPRPRNIVKKPVSLIIERVTGDVPVTLDPVGEGEGEKPSA
ncbi:hypothetical protein ES703_14965 [subsurface metagenome]